MQDISSFSSTPGASPARPAHKRTASDKKAPFSPAPAVLADDENIPRVITQRFFFYGVDVFYLECGEAVVALLKGWMGAGVGT